jgi:hypothetical protein
MLQSDYGLTEIDPSDAGLGDLKWAVQQVLVGNKAGGKDFSWSKFKSEYLQSNKELLAAFQAKQDDAKAMDLIKYNELRSAVTRIDSGLSGITQYSNYKGLTEEERYAKLYPDPNFGGLRSTQEMLNRAGVNDVKIDTYDSFLKAKETLEGLKKSLIGVTDLKADLDGLNGKLATTKSALSTIPKVDIAGFTSANVGTMKATSIQDYLAQLPTATGVGVDSAKAASNVAMSATKTIGASPVLSVAGNVSQSGAKDIIVRLDALSTQWVKYWDNGAKLELERHIKGIEDLSKWQDLELKWRDQNKEWSQAEANQELTWRTEDLAGDALWKEELRLNRASDIERETLFHGEVVSAIHSIPAPAPANNESFDVGTAYVEKDMPANVHKGEIIIDPQSANVLRKYGIRMQTGEGNGQANNQRIEELLTALLTEIRMSNQNGELRDARIVEAVNNMENTVAAPVVAALRKGQQPTLIRK